MIWLFFALLTGVAVLSILWPLSRPAPKRGEDAADVAFYRAQIAEIDAELSRGGIEKNQADSAKAEAARRLLSVAPDEVAVADSPGARKIAAVLALIAAPAIALGLYARIGHPALPDLPLQARLSAPPAQEDFAAVVARMEAHLAAHPEDGRALELMAPVYLRAGRYDEAVKARGQAMKLLGETPDRLVKYAEALSYANDGMVSPEAVDQLERALALDPRNLQARYFLGLAAAQHEDKAKAREVWTALLADLPEGSRARIDVIEKLAMLDAPLDGGPAPASGQPSGEASGKGAAPPADAAAAVAAQPADEQQKTIHAMVDRLAQRLASQGGSADEWMRLIRAYKVLNEPDRAQNAYDQARKALPDAESQQKLAALAKELGLNGT
ncbi:c-type cytochrome biogenesis protein CcmI [Rhodoblastus sp. 17X3]|uniref:c-type cytochrome biogenesis protein CcmI n=1 Tax=Rhodoblastus sp. 17X3 TaxID=3047026 RepID=UPI0024B7AC94|nr:c-type cytochrome biogenesis protein CcmI [Rhodoblastus sp. 17X3]MDI9849092.1 c-type cytochrome biogenesis protein CcmI [Rhodoblastus sp. 17X3]